MGGFASPQLRAGIPGRTQGKIGALPLTQEGVFTYLYAVLYHRAIARAMRNF